MASALLALGVGATTVYLGTHWVSDVLLGWAAGLLILLALPWFEPAMARIEEWISDSWSRRRFRSTAPLAASTASDSALVPSLLTDDEAGREPVGAGSRGAGPGGAGAASVVANAGTAGGTHATGTSAPGARRAHRARPGRQPPAAGGPADAPAGAAVHPCQQRRTRSSSTVKLSRPRTYSIVTTAPGGRLRTVVQPRARACSSASASVSPR